VIKRLLKVSTNTITSAAVIVASFSILSRGVGFIRDRILAGAFGASDALDIYFTAFRVPDLFYQLLVVGALSASFIPLFTKYYSKKQYDDAWFLTSNLLNIIAIGFGALSIFGAIFAPALVPLIAPGFTPEKQMAVATLTRVMLISQVFLSVSMVFGSALQGARHFLLYSLAPIFYNIGIILGAVVLVPLLGLIGLAWGVVLGGFMHFAIQGIGVYSLGYKYKPVFNFKSPDVKYTLKHMPPRVLGLAVNQVNFLAMTVIASLLATGSVTMLQFAYNLNFFPIGVFAVSYAIAVFPTLCEQAEQEDQDAFVRSFSTTVRQMMLFIAPATVIFILLRAQIVRVVVGAGAFDWPATILTADTLGWFVVSLFAQSIVFILVRAFFAKDDTMTPFLGGLIAAAINVIAALSLSKIYGVIGLGMAYSISAIVQMVLLWTLLRRKTKTLDERKIAKSFAILFAAAAFCALATQGMKSVVVRFISLDTFLGVLAQGLIAGSVGFAVFVSAAFLLKSPEMYEFLRGLKRRFWKRVKPEEQIVTNLTS